MNAACRSVVLGVMGCVMSIGVLAGCNEEDITKPLDCPVVTPTGAEVQLFDGYNNGGIVNGGTPYLFNLAVPTIVTWVATYHFNGGAGVTPGKIGFVDTKTGAVCSFTASAESSNPNPVNWIITPGVRLEPGLYGIVDSDDKTWSSNAQSGGKGFARIRGVPVLAAGGGTEPTPVRDGRMGVASCVNTPHGAWSVDFNLSSNGKPITLAVFSENPASRPALKLTAVPVGTLLDTQNGSSNNATATLFIPVTVDVSQPLTLTITECGQVSTLDVSRLAIQVFQ